MPRALDACKKREILDLLNEDRFVELAPAEVCAMLLDEGRYLCSERTMYRILTEQHVIRGMRPTDHAWKNDHKNMMLAAWKTQTPNPFRNVPVAAPNSGTRF